MAICQRDGCENEFEMTRALQKYCCPECRVANASGRGKAARRRGQQPCPVCGGEVKPPKTKYCSDACTAGVKKKRNHTNAAEERRLNSESMREMRAATCDFVKRTCLRCPATFISEGAQNRICPKCNYADGVEGRTSPMGQREGFGMRVRTG